MARLALAAAPDRALDVVVGGLGLGYTAQTVLDDPRVRSLVVVDALAPVIDWHERGLVPVSVSSSSDPRCSLLLGDFFALTAIRRVLPGRRRAALRRDRGRHRPLPAAPAAPEPRRLLHALRRTGSRLAAAAGRGVHAVVERPAGRRLPRRADKARSSTCGATWSASPTRCRTARRPTRCTSRSPRMRERRLALTAATVAGSRARSRASRPGSGRRTSWPSRRRQHHGRRR